MKPKLYYVHNDLLHTVKVFYELPDAERAADQWSYVQEIALAKDDRISYAENIDVNQLPQIG